MSTNKDHQPQDLKELYDALKQIESQDVDQTSAKSQLYTVLDHFIAADRQDNALPSTASDNSILLAIRPLHIALKKWEHASPEAKGRMMDTIYQQARVTIMRLKTAHTIYGNTNFGNGRDFVSWL